LFNIWFEIVTSSIRSTTVPKYRLHSILFDKQKWFNLLNEISPFLTKLWLHSSRLSYTYIIYRLINLCYNNATIYNSFPNNDTLLLFLQKHLELFASQLSIIMVVVSDPPTSLAFCPFESRVKHSRWLVTRNNQTLFIPIISSHVPYILNICLLYSSIVIHLLLYLYLINSLVLIKTS